jgi:hypothetical protein
MTEPSSCGNAPPTATPQPSRRRPGLASAASSNTRPRSLRRTSSSRRCSPGTLDRRSRHLLEWAGDASAQPARARHPSMQQTQLASWDSNRVSVANTARSARDRRGRRTWRRNTATSCRSTRISAFFDRELRASSPTRPSPAGRRDRAVEPPRPAIMPDGRHPATPQVTAMDDQFGTHRGTSRVSASLARVRLCCAAPSRCPPSRRRAGRWSRCPCMPA